jgi:NAD(P)H-dependent flavin oxidoreductase YrpB (nitropropane dioxygenase family)
VLRNPAAEKLLEKKAVPLVDAVSAGLHMRKILGLSWGQLFKEANNLRKQATGVGGGQRGLGSAMRFAVGGRLFAKATVEGDTVNGILMIGQTTGRIKDITTVANVLDRTVKEAEEILQTMNKQFAS